MVETVLENRMTWPDTDTGWSVNGRALPDSSSPGWSSVADDVSTLSLGTRISFVMLDRPRTVHLMHEQRSGSWKSINTHRGRREIDATFQTAWLDHGTAPDNDDFAYLLLPGVEHRRAQQAAGQSAMTVLANDAGRQAVGAGDFTGIVGHDPGT